jgi:hypothetical protein
MPPAIKATVIPTGGAVRLDMPAYLAPPSGVTNMLLTRAVSGSTGLGAFTTLYSGKAQPVWIDIGDNLPGPLQAASGYVYQLTDSTGTSQVGPVLPAPSLVPMGDPLSKMLLKLLQAGIDNIPLARGYAPVQITTKMPTGGLTPGPYIVLNLDLTQQSETGIGQDVINPDAGNIWTIWVNAKRMWRLTILSQDVEERDFYKDAFISIYQVILATVFTPVGLGVTRDIQAATYTVSMEEGGRGPSFYGADLMLMADGVLNTTVVTGYGLIEYISVAVEGVGATNSDNLEFEFTIPVSA